MKQHPILSETDALLVVDVQNDFMPGGALAVARGDEVVAPLNHLLSMFGRRALTIVATRDWHTADHCSFQVQGGTWPPHCVAGTAGAQFHPALMLPDRTHIVSKAQTPERDAYSGFDNTQLAPWLARRGIEHLLVGGLATDYCIVHTVLDGLQAGFRITLLTDAIRAVNVEADDGAQAIARMVSAGAELRASAPYLEADPTD